MIALQTENPSSTNSTLAQEKEVYLSKAKKFIAHNSYIVNTIEQNNETHHQNYYHHYLDAVTQQQYPLVSRWFFPTRSTHRNIPMLKIGVGIILTGTDSAKVL
ncbi:hypothetical protein ACMAZF_20125 (plasmid) [Psychrobium sp. nBUS_13]|uniref:hypothetical protein n=1 Tax=Psychrobium sp. nBUS_13 TaxID=3395319 RepID=UPI003EBFB008